MERRWPVMNCDNKAGLPVEASGERREAVEAKTGAEGRNRTGTGLKGPRDFKSLVSTNSTTSAQLRLQETCKYVISGSFDGLCPRLLISCCIDTC
jgi:hypothetical protein